MSSTKYLAMRQVYEWEKNEDGTIKYYEVPNPFYRPNSTVSVMGAASAVYSAPPTVQKPKSIKAEGKFKAFGTKGGRVVSLYDLPGKAASRCGKEGYVAELNPEDCRKYNASLEEQFAHCEARMLFWGAEADRLKKEMEAVNG